MSDKKQTGSGLSRRELLKKGGTLGGGLATVTLFGGCSDSGGGGGSSTGQVAIPRSPQRMPNTSLFLNETELTALNALCDRFIPGAPEDPDPGAVEAGCADAINLLLSAFIFDPPLIFAGGPFSDRGGAEHNDFADFVPLDKYEEFAWRLKIEGSQGMPEREFNGERKGWQQIYREGLAALDAAAASYGAPDFATLPGPTRDLLINGSEDPMIADLVNVAFPHTLDTMYGAPEYGGNRNLVGWGFTEFEGDVQPRGYTDEEVTQPDNPGLFDLLPGPVGSGVTTGESRIPTAALLPVPTLEEAQDMQKAFNELVAMTSGELALGMLLSSQGDFSAMRKEVSKLTPSSAQKGDK